ncbi:DUF2975 domain-containing protein [Verrucomicrobia bacterium]|nr:DUF2975 domain-containing protein [Verrucomicrobiota bacterium]MDA7657326.1 DUF2975 domain-containing protein [Verrucomicrobiota bacterium]MDA7866539.1 DUF2975 domain-containing protein [Verrucomicrobiota bacterium]
MHERPRGRIIIVVPKYKSVRLSRLLRFLCIVAFAQHLALLLFALFLPMVSVERIYPQPPNPEIEEISPRPSTNPVSKEFMERDSRWFLQLAEKRPKLQRFDYQPGSTLKPDRAILARSIAIFTMAYSILGPWVFFRLFDSYSKGCVFEVKNVRLLKHIGWWLIGSYPIVLLFEISKTYWSTPRIFSINPDGMFFLGLFIFMIAAIIDEATKMNEELAETI